MLKKNFTDPQRLGITGLWLQHQETEAAFPPLLEGGKNTGGKSCMQGDVLKSAAFFSYSSASLMQRMIFQKELSASAHTTSSSWTTLAIPRGSWLVSGGCQRPFKILFQMI